MELFYVIAVLFVSYWFYKGYKWVQYKNKYPILSAEIPSGILCVGDEASFGKNTRRYLGIDNKHGDILYVFDGETLDNVYYNEKELTERLDAVYGQYGIKWKKVK